MPSATAMATTLVSMLVVPSLWLGAVEAEDSSSLAGKESEGKGRSEVSFPSSSHPIPGSEMGPGVDGRLGSESELVAELTSAALVRRRDPRPRDPGDRSEGVGDLVVVLDRLAPAGGFRSAGGLLLAHRPRLLGRREAAPTGLVRRFRLGGERLRFRLRPRLADSWVDRWRAERDSCSRRLAVAIERVCFWL